MVDSEIRYFPIFVIIPRLFFGRGFMILFWILWYVPGAGVLRPSFWNLWSVTGVGSFVVVVLKSGLVLKWNQMGFLYGRQMEFMLSFHIQVSFSSPTHLPVYKK